MFKSPCTDRIAKIKRCQYQDVKVGCKDDAKDLPASEFPVISYSLVSLRTQPTAFSAITPRESNYKLW